MRPRSQSGAFILILIGVAFLLVNLGVLPIRDLAHLLATWWPLILIAIGVWQLARPRKSDS
jgi:hypothetical protein